MKGTNRRQFLKLLGASALAPAIAKAEAFEEKVDLGSIGTLELSKTVERRSICMWCSVGCGLIFYTKGNDVLDVEGDPDNPLNRGKLCVKGKASIAMFGSKNPLRLKNPMIRTNPKPDYKKFIEMKDADEMYNYLKQFKPVWKEVTWEEAFAYISKKWKELLKESNVKAYHEYDGKVCDSKAGCYFYEGNKYPIMIMAGAKLLNEEAYVIRKMSMLFGSNNIDHDARRCHSSTVAGLAATLGFGAQTQSFPDVGYIAVYLILGGNPADAHPVSMKPVIESKERGTLKLVVVDPKFGRTAAKANLFAFHRPGTDVALLYYILHYAFYEKKIDQLEAFKEYIKRTNVDMEEINEFKELVKRYDANEVSKITGVPVDKLKKIAELYVNNSGVATNFKRFSSIEWAMGLTQHTTGVQNIRAAAIVQLALGNMGFPGGGLNPYRGHNNVQGTTDMCILAHVFPGYIKIPSNSKQIRAYQEWKLQGFPDAFNWKPSQSACKALGLKCSCNGNECSLEVNSKALLWSWWFMNWRRFELTMGTFVGTEPEDRPWDENSKVISDLPFFVGYNEITYVKGTLVDDVLKGILLFAENPAVSDPNAKLTWASLSKMKLVVLADVFETETAWFADVLLPGAIQYEKEGSITNSNRWLQWSDRVALPPGDAKPDLWIMVKLYERLRQDGIVRLPSEEAGKNKEEVTVIHPYTKEKIVMYERPIEPYMDYSYPSQWEDFSEVNPRIVYREIDAAVDLYNGMYDWAHMYPLAKRRVAQPRSVKEVDGLLDSGALKHPNTNTPLRLYKDWGWSWPKNVRILYNLWTLEKTFGMEDYWEFPKGKYAVGESLDGRRVRITGETGEIVDSKTGTLRPAFVPGHNFYLGKFYKRAWTVYGKQMTDLFGGVANPSELMKEGKSLGITVLINKNGYKVVKLSELGVRYPVQESVYYDPEVVEKGKALFKKPYFVGTKVVEGKKVKYVDWKEWKEYHDSFISEFSSCVGNDPNNYRPCVKKFIEKYGEWFAIGRKGVTLAYSLDYPMHFEPAESPSLELAKKYPQIAWRKPFNKMFIFPPKVLPQLGAEIALTLGELERQMPKDAKPIVLTTNRLEEHWHTGALSRNNPYLAELVPEPFAHIPEPLAKELGIKSGDVVEIGSARAKIYVRAMVTHRMPKLDIAGETVYNVNIPWPFGYAGSHRTPSVANLLTPEVGDIITSIQESKVFLGWIRKAPKDKYVFEREAELPNIREEGWL
ncbi:formate dehydrogenase [Ignicoccus pacificus DSM 13166]|uniref:Formate dehydrogenase n=1 Tax=Ignicoccus pacificus DSM 13166 TaxID=940294 RepID=A0A977K9T4_9CREN|nr:formate dehydrogenase [Ignicoccus pacificus DSM 13166]